MRFWLWSRDRVGETTVTVPGDAVEDDRLVMVDEGETGSVLVTVLMGGPRVNWA